MDSSDYAGREAAFVKHFVLEKYLEQLAFKIGQFNPPTTLNYIDGFSGPWQNRRSDHGDSSPAIALRQLGLVRDELARAGRPIKFRPRGMFVERDASAFEQLRVILESSNMETVSIRGDFEEHVAQAVDFASTGPNPFAFTFIDPTGWTGFGLHAITPLLRVRPGEVLINFMLKAIVRFIDWPEPALRPSFDDLFGQRSEEYLGRWKSLHDREREDAIVAAYSERIRDAGEFRFVGSTVILNPLQDRTHYHLVYATRSLHGLVTFREVERAAFPRQKQVRAEAKAQHRDQVSGQAALFGAAEMDTSYADDVRSRYQDMARTELERGVAPGSDVEYDELLGRVLRFPITSRADVNGWLAELQDAGCVEFVGFDKTQRVPKIGEGHRIRGK